MSVNVDVTVGREEDGNDKTRQGSLNAPHTLSPVRR